MTVLDFIFGVLCLVAGVFVITGITVTVCDTAKLEKENDKLKEELEKARKKVLKREYKKVKEVK